MGVESYFTSGGSIEAMRHDECHRCTGAYVGSWFHSWYEMDELPYDAGRTLDLGAAHDVSGYNGCLHVLFIWVWSSVVEVLRSSICRSLMTG